MPSRILVVDDNKSIVEIIKMDFELRGHKVFTAYDGEEAEAAIKENPPDLIILDVMMPKKNGYSVCRDLKRNAELSKIPVILLTAKNTKNDIYWGYDSGADAYVTKPYEPRELINLADQLIEEAKQGKKRHSWTGLPDASVVEKEAFFRKDAGGEALLVNFEFDEEEKGTFLQKYGAAAFREQVHSLAWKLSNNLREVSPTAIIGQYGNDNFLLLLHPSEEEKARNRLMTVSESLIKSSYDGEDQETRGILKRDVVGQVEVLVPIMTMRWKAGIP